MKCFRHDRPAVKELNIPCAPNGKLPVCAECADPANGAEVFKAYKEKHNARVTLFKGVKGNPRN
jgi:hypothetical protein